MKLLGWVMYMWWLMKRVVVDGIGKCVESEIVGVASGVDVLVSSWCSPLVLARLDVTKSTGGFETARLPITPCISANHLKLTNILQSSRSSSDSIPTPLALSLSIVSLYFFFRAFIFSRHCLYVCI